jgi:hypothetical protein
VIYAYNEYVIFVNRNYSKTCNDTGTEISIFLLEAVTKRLVYEGRFPFNGLTGQTRILLSVSMGRSGLYFSNI